MDDFSFELVKEGNKVLLSLSGYLNEQAELPSLRESQASIVEVNFDNLRMLNSTGIAIWIKWLNEFGKDIHFDFYNCGKEVVEQINAVSGFKPADCTLHSVYVPYYCEETDDSARVLVTRKEHFHEQEGDQDAFLKLPEFSKEGHDYTPDIFPERYFGFLKN